MAAAAAAAAVKATANAFVYSQISLQVLKRLLSLLVLPAWKIFGEVRLLGCIGTFLAKIHAHLQWILIISGACQQQQDFF